MAGPSNPKRADPEAEYGQALGGALRSGLAELLQHADELERVQTEEEDRRRELEAKLSLGSQDRPMVPMREWVRNPYFVGGLASDEPGGLFPKLKEDLEEVFDGRGGLGYYEVVIGGASGFGKTSGLMRAIMLRCLYEVSCYANPQRGISPDRGMVATDSILLANYSFTEANARSTLYTYLQRSVDSIDYFKECFPRDPKYTKEMRFPRNVVVRPGITVDTGATAENLLTAVMDEANKYPLVEHSDRVRAQGEVYDVAEKLRGQCFNRQRNRFMLTGGEMPRTAKLVVGCSAQYPDDFVERRTEMARSGKLEHAVLVIRYPEWGTKPRSMYTLPWVTVMVSPEGGAEVLDGDDAAERRVELESRGWVAHEVPGEHVPSFREAPELSVRELLGIATKAIEPFMRKREAVVAAVAARREASDSMRLGAAGTQHPFTVVETTLRDAAQFVREYLCAPDPTEGGELRPRVSPGATRYAHFDLSENKCGTGFCVGHVLDVREIARSRREEGGGVERAVERAPWIWPDFYLRIVAPKDEVVDYAACRSLVFEMTAMGFRFGMVSFDQWQCVSKGTIVNTARGLIPVEEVVPGDFVQSRTGMRRVRRRLDFGERPTLRIVTEDGDVLEGTGRHRIEAMVGLRRGGPRWDWKRLDALQVGDVVHTSEGPADLGIRHDAPLANSAYRHSPYHPRARLRGWQPPDRMTVAFAEWLGLVWGDGAICEDSVTVSVARAEADDARTVFARVFGGDFQYKARGEVHGVVSVSGRGLTRWLRTNEMVKPLIPNAVLRSSRAVLAAFLRGLFSADGGVDPNDGAAKFYTKHAGLAHQVQVALRTEFGLQSVVFPVEKSDHFGGDYGTHYVLSVRGSRRRFFEQIGFCYSTKAMRMARHLHRPGRSFLSRVRSITPSRAVVYDLTVDGDPSYVANGFVSHNSADSRQRLEERGYDVGLVSMDRDDGAYQALRRATYEGRLLLYDYEPLFDELLSVEMVKGKVVPRRGKTKDVADALAAVVQHCETLGMTQQSWNDPDARMVLAPFSTSAYAPPTGAPVQGLGVPRAHLESHGMGTYLDDLDARPEGPPEINTRTYGRGPKAPRDDLLSRALARSSGTARRVR